MVGLLLVHLPSDVSVGDVAVVGFLITQAYVLTGSVGAPCVVLQLLCVDGPCLILRCQLSSHGQVWSSGADSRHHKQHANHHHKQTQVVACMGCTCSCTEADQPV